MRQAAFAAALIAAMAHSSAHAAIWVANIGGSGIHQVTAEDIPISWTGRVTV